MEKLNKIIKLYEQKISEAKERVKKYSGGNTQLYAQLRTGAEHDADAYEETLEVLKKLGALTWWDHLPGQNLEDASKSKAAYCMKYYPKETSCWSLNDDQVLNIWEKELKK